MTNAHTHTEKDRSEHGAAYLEAVIALPVMILIWFGSTFVFKLNRERIEALGKARECVLGYANAGCPEELPEGCEDILRTKASSAGGEIDASLSTHTDSLTSVGSGAAYTLFTIILGKGVTGSETRGVRRPELDGLSTHHDPSDWARGTSMVVGDYYVLCNEEARSPAEVIKDVAPSVWEGF